MEILTLNEIADLHISKLVDYNDKKEVKLPEYFSFFIGDDKDEVFKLLDIDISDFEKRILITVLGSELRNLMELYVSSLSGSEKGFEIHISVLIKTVITRALPFIGRDGAEGDELYRLVIWSTWVCITILKICGWDAYEFPRRMFVEGEGANKTATLNPEPIEKIKVFMTFSEPVHV